ncbi:MAG: PD40 domain-containing protein, partial [Victivallales bacterium]|nr:PD40 domain-containing protein [Victivallales bacterium]
KYYSDGTSIRQSALSASLRTILWEPPKLLEGYINQVRNNRDATISPDGKMIILSHEREAGNYDLYVSYKKKNGWSKQTALGTINSAYNDLGPEFSGDGKFLFFHSERPGGYGGYDIWYSHRDGERWSRPLNIGKHINTNANEVEPSISPDNLKIFFSSDRPDSNADSRSDTPDYDIYVATAEKETDDSKDIIPTPPEYSKPTNMRAINSKFDERKAIITSRENTIYFSSNREGGEGGFDLYRSYFVENRFMEPENFGTPINSKFDEISPTMTLEGFGIYFSSNRLSRNPADYNVYQSTSREVVKKFDYAALMRLIMGLIAIIIAVALIYLILRLMLADTRLGMVAKCLLAAVVIHLIAALICALWIFSSDFIEMLKPAPKELTININNLARESIAMAIKESVASLPKVQTTSVVERLPIPTQQPVTDKSTPTKQTATVPKTSATPVSMKMTRQVQSESPPTGKVVPSLKPFQAGANIKMEAPVGNAPGVASDSTGKSDDGLPQPKFRPKRQPRELPKVVLDTVPLNMDITQVEAPTDAVVKHNSAGPPSAEKALSTSSRIATTPDGKDPTADQLLLAASTIPTHAMRNSLGTLRFTTRIVMEQAQN